jgi:signal transduction histidine kinase
MNGGLAAVVATALVLILLGLLARERARRRSLEAELNDERRRHHAAAHASDEFFHNVSHELRSPIAAILGYQELLGDGAYGPLHDAATEPVDRIGRSADHLLHLVDGAVDLGRIRSGLAEPRIESVDLRPLLDGAAADLRRHGEERGISIHIEVEPPREPFPTDPDRLTRAIHLLAVAAVRRPVSELRFEARRRNHALEVRISGADFPDSSAHDLAARCGIRVAIAEATARLLGGSLQILALGEGRGSELLLRIPAAPFDEGGRGE